MNVPSPPQGLPVGQVGAASREQAACGPVVVQRLLEVLEGLTAGTRYVNLDQEPE